MKEYVDLILKKEKKSIDMVKLYKKIEKIKQLEDPKYVLSCEEMYELDSILAKGIEKYEYYKTPNGNYTLLSKTSFRKGRFHGNRVGEGFVTSKTTCITKDGKRILKEEKFDISKDNRNNAVDGDCVLIDIGGNGKKPSVLKIIDRNIGNIVGTVTKIGSKYYVKPIDKKKQFLTIELNENIEEGSIVSVSLDEIKDDNYYIGTINRVFKHANSVHSEVLFEAFKSGMPEGFSPESMKQLERIPNEVSEKDKQFRYDFTDWEIFSIDGADTKDKDDAISLKMLPNGNYLLGVHIADVAYYVKENTPIDKDAFRKGTSYYFGGLVEPQLPTKLSNGICSLNENVERLTKSVIMEFDTNGNVVNKFLVPSVIKSRASLTYEKVNELLRGENVEEYLPFKDTLEKMKDLAYILRKKRTLEGAIIFNRPELRFKHDELGNPVEVALRYEETSEMLIEEFMLQANSNVSKILAEAKIPCIYRVHDVPNSERLGEFLRLLNVINMPFESSEEDILDDKKVLQLLSIHINKSRDFSPMLNTNLIKCMSHALYSTSNIGHYGTGFDMYCHFTSPIRRLADYGISRIIDECYFEKNSQVKDRNIKKWNDLANDYATQASKMEKVEEEVEKNVLYLDTALYLSNFIGEEFEATVITLSNNGICVQLDNLLEGKVRNRNLVGEYVYNPLNFTLVSIESKGNYYVGDRLKLKLVNTSPESKVVDFVVLEKIKENVIKDRHLSNQFIKIKTLEEKNRKTYN